MRTVLNNAAFGTPSSDSEGNLESLVEQGREILSRAEDLAGGGERDRNSND
jgi:hypothetical protein